MAHFLFSPVICPTEKIIHPIAIKISPIATENAVCFSIQITIAIINPMKLRAVATTVNIFASVFFH